MEEAFEGVIKFDTSLLIIDIFLLVFFLVDWYSHYRRTGAYIDYWYYNTFLSFFVPVLIMYPFTSSPLNVFTVLGYNNLYVIERFTSEAYIVTVVGFASAYLGRYLFDNFKPIAAIENIIALFSNTLGKAYIAVTNNTKVARTFALGYITTLLCFIFLMALTGQLRNPREFFMLNRQYGPIYTLILSTFDITFIIVSTRALQLKKKYDKLLLAGLTILGFFLGVRAPIILGGLSFGVLYVITYKKGYIPLTKIAFFIVVILILVMALAFFRNSGKMDEFDLNIAMLSFLPEIFYGNTFSDLRDFSWVIGYWDREYYWGLSYLAAFLSFIPSWILPIRDIYGIGKITVRAAGLDTTTHPGLRMGMFGEMYINFGIVGVIIFGFFWGYVFRRLDKLTKKYASSGNVFKATSVLVYSSFISYLPVTAGFWGFYITCFMLAVLYLSTRIRFVK